MVWESKAVSCSLRPPLSISGRLSIPRGPLLSVLGESVHSSLGWPVLHCTAPAPQLTAQRLMFGMQIGRYIAGRGGTVVAEELAPFLDLKPGELASDRNRVTGALLCLLCVPCCAAICVRAAAPRCALPDVHVALRHVCACCIPPDAPRHPCGCCSCTEESQSCLSCEIFHLI